MTPDGSAPVEPVLLRLDPGRVKPREWLWRNVLPIGKFVGVEGEGLVTLRAVLSRAEQ